MPWCDIIETPCGAQLRRYNPEPRQYHILRPLGDRCATCRDPHTRWYKEPDGRRVGPLCMVTAVGVDGSRPEARRGRR